MTCWDQDQLPVHGKLGVGGGGGGQAAPFLPLCPFPMAEICEDRAAISCLPSAQERGNVCKGRLQRTDSEEKGLWQGQAPLEIQSGEGGGSKRLKLELLAPSL